MRKSVEDTMARLDIESKENWRDWITKIPSFTFPKGVSITPCPPFLGALARFRVVLTSDPDIDVSVYLDVNESLGFWGGKPYWEIYPDTHDDNMRFDLNDTPAVVKKIMASLSKRKREKKKLALKQQALKQLPP